MPQEIAVRPEELISHSHRSLWSDGVILVFLASLIGFGLHLAVQAPRVVQGPQLSLALPDLPLYAAFSLGRLLAAYALSLFLMFVYGYAAAYYRGTRWFLLPLLDVLQSVPLFSFLPVIILTFSAIFPQRLAIEFSSIMLLFTCLGWNLIYAWYQSLTTVPHELQEAGRIFQFNRYLRFRHIEFPFARIPLIWNSMISWANGWFFLMAAEIFTLGERDFRLPGLGAYLKEAASQGNVRAEAWGILLLVGLIVTLDQIIWRPLLAWAERRNLEAGEAVKASSWFYDALINSRMIRFTKDKVFSPAGDWFEALLRREKRPQRLKAPPVWRRRLLMVILWTAAGILVARGSLYCLNLLFQVSLPQWGEIVTGAFLSFLRVLFALILALAWTVPVGVMIGTNRRLARWLQPLVQLVASIPATALFPAFLLIFLSLPFGLNVAAIFLMLMGTQWYLLFNIIAGASAIPRELNYISDLMQLSRRERWRQLILPAIFPFMVTGAVVTTGGAWNASIVAEYVEFGGRTFFTHGLGSVIARATAEANYPLLLAATLSMIFTVVFINRFFWQRLYALAEEKYRLDEE